MSEQRDLYALLVGIDDYASPRVPNLGGCVNDIETMAQLLTDRFQVPEENITILPNNKATYEAVKAAFREQLIDRAKAWVADGRQGEPPAFLFEYSGHGSQAIDPTGTEPDGLDETMVCHDSRLPDIYDLKDWELGALIDELTQNFIDPATGNYSGNVTIIMDCCHSGGGTRDITDETLIPTRRCEPDMREQVTVRPATRSVTAEAPTDSGWFKKDERYVLLAGCRDREESNEYRVREGDDFRQHGAMTYFMVKELSSMGEDSPMTYRELHEKVRLQVNTLYKTQMPQCEGDRDREIFGGMRPKRDPFLAVSKKERGMVYVNGGMAHGLTAGSVLTVYPPDTREVGGATAIATLRARVVGSIETGCEVTEGDLDAIPELAKAAIHLLDPAGMQRTVSLQIDDASLRQHVEKRLAEADIKKYVDRVEAGTPAEFLIVGKPDQLEIQNGAGDLLVAPFKLDNMLELGDDLAHLIRYRNALELSNPGSALAGKMTLELKRLDFDATTGDPIAVPFERSEGGELVIETGVSVVLEITNRGREDLYFSVLLFGHSWDVVMVYPEVSGANEALKGGGRYYLGLSSDPDEQFEFNLDADMPEAREVFKLIATKDPADFEILAQGELKTGYTKRSLRATSDDSPINQLLTLAMENEPDTRAAFGKRKASVQDEWVTTELSCTVVKPADDEAVTHAISGGGKTRMAAFDMEIEAPAGFSGSVRVMTERQNTRAVGDMTDFAPPPGFAGLGNAIQPMPVKSTRAAGPSGAIIEVEADDLARAAVTADTPLKMRLPGEVIRAGEGVMALAYEGGVFYPVGSTDTSEMDINWLPPSTPAAAEAIGTRSIGRTLKLYLFKSLNLDNPELGHRLLRYIPTAELAANPVDDNVETAYPIAAGELRIKKDRLKQGDIKAGTRVAVLVHGFNGESRSMASKLLPFLVNNDAPYDYYLSYDYESYKTDLKFEGSDFASPLLDEGFGADDGIHVDVFAHGMGALVVRSAIEYYRGDEFIDRVIMAGPPNSGTALANAKWFIPWVISTLVTIPTGFTAGGIAFTALKRLESDAQAIDALRPKSGYIKEINRETGAVTVPYYILAGEHMFTSDQQGVGQRLLNTFLQKADPLFDAFFKGPNDLITDVKSMTTVRKGHFPEELLHIATVPCNHFGYFTTTEAQAQILEWVNDLK